MRIDGRLSKMFWAKVVRTTTNLINHGPSMPLGEKLSKEVWSTKEVNFSHLRAFCCISYVHINSSEKSKLNTKSKKCVFVRYDFDEFGYQFWDFENWKFIISKNVIFNEKEMYKEKSYVESTNTKVEIEKSKYIEFEKNSKKEVQSRNRKNPVNEVS